MASTQATEIPLLDSIAEARSTQFQEFLEFDVIRNTFFYKCEPEINSLYIGPYSCRRKGVLQRLDSCNDSKRSSSSCCQYRCAS